MSPSYLPVIDPPAADRPRERVGVVSLADLARRPLDTLPRFDGAFTITRPDTVRMVMNEQGWREAFRRFGAPREWIESQSLYRVGDRNLGTEAIYSALRGRRTPPEATEVPAGGPPHPDDCPGCRPDGWHRDGLWVDEPFGEVISRDGRVRARANWARQAPVSGIVFGGRPMHDLRSLERDQFVALFDAGEEYIRRVRAAMPEARYFMALLNGGPRAGGSVGHAHLSIVGDASRHFGFPEVVRRRCPADYWRLVEDAHEEVGLTVRAGECTAWASLVPLKERDVCAVSATLRDGAGFVYDLLRALMAGGAVDFSLAAILAPHYVAPDRPADGFSSWPPVLWRFVDRGAPGLRYGDIGCMELFGGSPVVSSDPFLVAHGLKSALSR